MPEAVWVVGDPQGWCAPLLRVLGEVKLIDADAHWTGKAARLVVAGDLVDRGPDGVGVIDLLMRLQLESDGRVQVVVGNHDVQLLAAHRFPSMRQEWLDTGGVTTDLERLTGTHVEWLASLPAMLSFEGTLVTHADALFYREYGASLEEVNAAFGRVLQGDDLAQWKLLLDRFREHRAFVGANGETNLKEFLQTFGYRKLIHGHSPIARTLDVPPESVTQAYVYHAGRCVAVDPGIYLGGPGFAYRER
jgi:hypothetical protein